ncbi:hypothetical protein [Bifidobacterium tibiigranuli]|uniref:hypothetical protein n=1 Tax=Bifidobacterium tibiigranuli TaxID=2172043 RepID=UPI002354150A|nr:hypothetical protein [Bifidobacterium tibiigranuli]MCI1791746.1 hypothetical protein [Bifidobacterium tibiigranuli]MCI1797459.1 hypothetical protein [Bifidobacterium tibiigranuli]MCI2186246.1 hypothetical protein [Bifidobacterium tibiigranuli]MCI2203928.1 hypothetical protein [Bifidobacterium tibiigranuli]
MWSRILVICQAQHWPGITHSNVWSLPLNVWLTLAVSCDRVVAQEAEQIRDMKRQAGR